MRSLTAPYRVTAPMIALAALVPLYLVIADLAARRPLHAPALSWDLVLPLGPAWGLVYGALYLYLIILPVFVVRQDDHIRRTVLAYLMVWTTAYLCFLVYPTVAPRPLQVPGSGFAAWGLRFLYAADPPYNCFPSLHVAHSFVSAWTCFPVHRRVGAAATLVASVVAVSTLFARQHYILDVGAGVLLAGLAWLVFLRPFRRDAVPEFDRRLAPVFAVGVVGLIAVAVACFWVAYQVRRHA